VRWEPNIPFFRKRRSFLAAPILVPASWADDMLWDNSQRTDPVWEESSMRILVIGAGAVGGYFGGRLLEGGRDVTFLVRPERAARLSEQGLIINSLAGAAQLASPPTLLASAVREPFDCILLSCKSYDLDNAIAAFASAVGPQSMIIPLLNGMRHLDLLDDHFGKDRVLGGRCLISARLDETGRIIHMSDLHELTFGAREPGQAARVAEIAKEFSGCRFEPRASNEIMIDMWEKWVFLATMAGMTCLTRAALGDIVRAGGQDVSLSLLTECHAIASAAGWSPREMFMESAVTRLSDPNSTLAASMLGDLERGGRTEADHIFGDLLARQQNPTPPEGSLLRLAYLVLKSHEARLARERSAAPGHK
jgi:2-dehydropantoate 2-reductase